MRACKARGLGRRVDSLAGVPDAAAVSASGSWGLQLLLMFINWIGVPAAFSVASRWRRGIAYISVTFSGLPYVDKGFAMFIFVIWMLFSRLS
jgi:hypothetical protein